MVSPLNYRNLCISKKKESTDGCCRFTPTASKEVLNCLNKIFQHEMSGIHRYLHYSFMIMGHNRIPIQKWFRDQANEAQAHSIMIGEEDHVAWRPSSHRLFHGRGDQPPRSP